MKRIAYWLILNCICIKPAKACSHIRNLCHYLLEFIHNGTLVDVSHNYEVVFWRAWQARSTIKSNTKIQS